MSHAARDSRKQSCNNSKRKWRQRCLGIMEAWTGITLSIMRPNCSKTPLSRYACLDVGKRAGKGTEREVDGCQRRYDILRSYRYSHQAKGDKERNRTRAGRFPVSWALSTHNSAQWCARLLLCSWKLNSSWPKFLNIKHFYIYST